MQVCDDCKAASGSIDQTAVWEFLGSPLKIRARDRRVVSSSGSSCVEGGFESDEQLLENTSC